MGWINRVRNEEERIRESQGGEEYPTNSKKKEGWLTWPHLA